MEQSSRSLNGGHTALSNAKENEAPLSGADNELAALKKALNDSEHERRVIRAEMESMRQQQQQARHGSLLPRAMTMRPTAAPHDEGRKSRQGVGELDQNVDVETCERRIKQLELELAQKSAEISAANERVSHTLAQGQLDEDDIDDLNEKNELAQARIAALENEVKEANATARDALSARESLEEELRLAKANESTATIEYEIVSSRLERLEEDLGRYRVAMDGITSDKEDLQKSLAAARGDAERLKAEKDEVNRNAKEQLMKAEAYVNHQADKILRLEEREQAAVHKYKIAEADVDRLSDQTRLYLEKIAELQSEKDGLLSKVDDLSTRNHDLEGRHESVLSELSETKAVLENSIMEARGALESAQHRQVSLQVTVNQLQDTVTSSLTTISSQRSKIAILERDLAAAQRERDNFDFQLQERTIMLSEAVRNLNASKVSLNAMESTLDERARLLSEVQQREIELSEEIERISSKRQSDIEEREKMALDLSLEVSQKEELATTMEKLRSDFIISQQRVSEMVKSHALDQEALSLLRNDAIEQQGKLELAERRITELEELCKTSSDAHLTALANLAISDDTIADNEAMIAEKDRELLEAVKKATSLESRLTDLLDKIALAEAAVTVKDRKIDFLSEEEKRLSAEIGRLANDHKGVQDEVESIRKQLIDVRNAEREARVALEAAELKNKSCEERAEATLIDLKRELASKSNDLVSMESSLSLTQRHVSHLESVRESLTSEVQTLKETISTLESRLMSTSELNVMLQEEREAEKAHFESKLEREHNLLLQSAKELSLSLDIATAEANASKEVAANAQSLVENLRSQLSTLLSQNADMLTDRDRLVRKSDAFQSELQIALQKSETMQTEFTKVTAELEEDLRATRKCVEELRLDVHTKNQEIDGLRKVTLQSPSLDVLTQEIETLKESLAGSIASEKDTRSVLEAKIEELDTTYTRTLEEMTVLRTVSGELTKKIAVAEDTAAKLDQENTSLKCLVEGICSSELKWRQDLERSESEATKFMAELADLRGDASKAKSKAISLFDNLQTHYHKVAHFNNSTVREPVYPHDAGDLCYYIDRVSTIADLVIDCGNCMMTQIDELSTDLHVATDQISLLESQGSDAKLLVSGLQERLDNQTALSEKTRSDLAIDLLELKGRLESTMAQLDDERCASLKIQKQLEECAAKLPGLIEERDEAKRVSEMAQSLQMQIVDLQKELFRSQEDCKGACLKAEASASKCSNGLEALENLQTVVRAYENQVFDLQTKLVQLTSAPVQSECLESEELKSRLDVAEKKYESAVNDLMVTKAELERSHEMLESVTLQNEDALQKKDALEEYSSSLLREIQVLQFKVDETTKDLTAKTDAMINLQSDLKLNHERVVQLQGMLDSLETIQQRSESDRKDLKERLVASSRIHAEAQEALAQLRSEFESVEDDKVAILQDLEALKSSTDIQISRLKGELENAVKALEGREADNAGLSSEVMACRMQIDSLSTEIEQLRENIKQGPDPGSSFDIVAALEDTVKALKAALVEKDGLIHEFENALNIAREHIEASFHDASLQKAALDSEVERTRRLETEALELQRTIGAIEELLAVERAEREAALAKSQAEIDLQQSTTNSIRAEHAELSEKLDSLLAENTCLKSKFQERDAELETLATAISLLLKRISAVESESSALINRMHEDGTVISGAVKAVTIAEQLGRKIEDTIAENEQSLDVTENLLLEVSTKIADLEQGVKIFELKSGSSHQQIEELRSDASSKLLLMKSKCEGLVLQLSAGASKIQELERELESLQLQSMVKSDGGSPHTSLDAQGEQSALIEIAVKECLELRTQLNEARMQASEYERRAEEIMQENQKINEKCLKLIKDNKKLSVIRQKLERTIEQLQETQVLTDGGPPIEARSPALATTHESTKEGAIAAPPTAMEPLSIKRPRSDEADGIPSKSQRTSIDLVTSHSQLGSASGPQSQSNNVQLSAVVQASVTASFVDGSQPATAEDSQRRQSHSNTSAAAGGPAGRSRRKTIPHATSGAESGTNGGCNQQ